MKQEMKYIKIFLAMSEEDMGAEFNELSDYIRSLNDLYIGRSIFFELCMPGETDADDIDGSQYFFLLFYRDADENIVEDFDIALKKFNANKTPKIVTYFKIAEEGSISEGVRSFMERLEKGLEHFYNKFDNIDTVKLSMLLEMARNQETKIDIEFQDGKVLADKKEVEDISLDNIPQYFKNEALNKLREERLRLEGEYVELRTAIKENPDDDELFRKLYDVNERKNKADEQFHQMEMDILKMTSTIVEMTSDGKPLTVRAKKAIEYFNAGDYENCKDVLDDEERRRAWEKADEKEAAQKAAIETEREGLINEIRIKIDTIKAQGINNESEKEIIELYEEAKEKIFEYNLNLELAIDYVVFLWEQKRLYGGIKIGEEIYKYFKWRRLIKEYEDYIDVLSLLGHLYYFTRQYEKAEEKCQELLDIGMKSIRDGINIGVGTCARLYSCGIEGLIYKAENRYGESENKLLEALNMWGMLNDQNRLYVQNEATSCKRFCEVFLYIYKYNLGILYQETGRNAEAEEKYEEALEIERKLSETNSSAYICDMVMSCNNLGILYQGTERNAEAEEKYEEALEIGRKLSETNSSAYICDMAMSCNNLGNLYYDVEKYKEAEEKWQEALDIYRELSETDRRARLRQSQVATNLGNLYQDIGKYKKAEEKWQEALRIYEELNEKNGAYAKKIKELSGIISLLNTKE